MRPHSLVRVIFISLPIPRARTTFDSPPPPSHTSLVVAAYYLMSSSSVRPRPSPKATEATKQPKTEPTPPPVPTKPADAYQERVREALARLSETDRRLVRIDQETMLVHKLRVEGDAFLVAFGLVDNVDDEDRKLNTAAGESASSSSQNTLTSTSGSTVPFAEVTKQIEAQVERAFFDSLAVGLSSDPPQMDRILPLFIDARDRLLNLAGCEDVDSARAALGNMTGPRGRIVTDLLETLDESFLRQRLGGPPLDLAYMDQLLSLVVRSGAALGSPAREDELRRSFTSLMEKLRLQNLYDEKQNKGREDDDDHDDEVKEEASSPPEQPPQVEPSTASSSSPPTSPSVMITPRTVAMPDGGVHLITPAARRMVEGARFVRTMLKNLHTDLARYRLQELPRAVDVGGGGVAYEQRWFQDLIGDRPVVDALPRTSQWLKAARAQAEAGARLGGERTAGMIPTSESAKIRFFVGLGLLSLMQIPRALGPLSAPETLVLDVERLVWLQNQLQHLSLVAALLLAAGQLLTTKKLAVDGELMRDLAKRFAILLDGSVSLDGLVAELCRHLARHVRSKGGIWNGEGSPGSVGGAGAEGGRGGEGSEGSASPAPSLSPSASASASTSATDDLTVSNLLQRMVDAESPVYQRVEGHIARALGACVVDRLREGSPSSSAAKRRGWETVTETGEEGGRDDQDHHEDEGSEACTAALRAVGAEMIRGEVELVADVVVKTVVSTCEVSTDVYRALLRDEVTTDG